MNYFEKGNEFYKNKDYKNAISMYKNSARLNINTASCLYNEAVCFIKMKKYDKAITLLKLAIKIKEDSKYYFNLGYCYSMQNENKKALVCFNTAWALNHEDSECEKAINLIINSYIKSINN